MEDCQDPQQAQKLNKFMPAEGHNNQCMFTTMSTHEESKLDSHPLQPTVSLMRASSISFYCSIVSPEHTDLTQTFA